MPLMLFDCYHYSAMISCDSKILAILFQFHVQNNIETIKYVTRYQNVRSNCYLKLLETILHNLRARK